jgi:hypothetical protein
MLAGMERTPSENAISLSGRLDKDMGEIEGRCELAMLDIECTEEMLGHYRAMLRATQEFRLHLAKLIEVANR